MAGDELEASLDGTDGLLPGAARRTGAPHGLLGPESQADRGTISVVASVKKGERESHHERVKLRSGRRLP